MLKVIFLFFHKEVHRNLPVKGISNKCKVKEFIIFTHLKIFIPLRLCEYQALNNLVNWFLIKGLEYILFHNLYLNGTLS